MKLLKSAYFWIATTLFITAAVVIGWKFLPPLITTMTTNKAALSAFKTQIAAEQQYAATLKGIASESSKIDELYSLARTALPVDGEGEQLLIQLDGLLASRDLSSATVTVPFSTGKTATAAASEEADGSSAAASSELTVSISGNISYAQTKTLLTDLKTFIRFNKVSEFTLTKSGESYTTTITMKAFSRPAPKTDFSGDVNFLDKATKFFANYQNYASRPDASTEGSYGREDPFAPTN